MTTTLAESIKAVALDWAGTTIDHGSRAPASVFMEVFRGQGVEITVAQVREPMGKAKREHIAAVLAMPDVSARWEAKFGAPPSNEDVNGLYETFLPLQLEVLADHCDLIPGAAEAVASCRQRGLKIGASTGYTRQLMDVVTPAAARQGYQPEVSVCSDDVPAGRPAPWMLFEVAKRLNVYPMSAIVAVDDTPVGIQAGQNAGTWTVAVTRSGNQLGLSLDEVRQLEAAELQRRLEDAAAVFRDLGAHFVIETIVALPKVLDEIHLRVTRGERP